MPSGEASDQQLQYLGAILKRIQQARKQFFLSSCETCFTCLSVITCEIRDLKLTGTLEAFRDVDGSVTWSLIGHVELCF